MGKYNTLWAYIHENGESQLTLTFDEIGQIAGVPLDHSFLKYRQYRTIRWQRRRCLFRHLLLADFSIYLQ